MRKVFLYLYKTYTAAWRVECVDLKRENWYINYLMCFLWSLFDEVVLELVQHLMFPRWVPPGIKPVLQWKVAFLGSFSFTFFPLSSPFPSPFLLEGKPGQQKSKTHFLYSKVTHIRPLQTLVDTCDLSMCRSSVNVKIVKNRMRLFLTLQSGCYVCY